MASVGSPMVVDEEADDVMIDYLTSGNDTLGVLVWGKLGTGKSSLVNGLIGREVAKEGMSAFSQTLEIRSYCSEVNVSVGSIVRPIRTIIWDTPGCGEVSEDEDTQERNLHEIIKQAQDADLLLYCLDMRLRLTRDDVGGMKELTERVGPDVWRNAVFVLTFANKVEPPPSDEGKNLEEHFQEVLSGWVSHLKQVLTNKVSLPEEIVKSVSVVPTGYRQTPPPDRDDWLSPFWFEAFHKTKADAQPALLGINLHRLTIKFPYQAKAAASVPITEQLEAHQQTININPNDLVETDSGIRALAGSVLLAYVLKPVEPALSRAVDGLSKELVLRAVNVVTKKLLPSAVQAVLAANGWRIATALGVGGVAVGSAVGVGVIVYAVLAHRAKKKAEADITQLNS